MKWLIENHIFEGRHQELLDEIKRRGHEYKEIDYLDCWPPNIPEFYPNNKDCVLFRGSLKLGKRILRHGPWTPGAYMDDKALQCTSYYPYFKDHLLNHDYVLLPLGELIRRKERVMQWLEAIDNKLFIRPNSGLKQFHAGVFDMNENLLSRLHAEPELLVLAARPVPISREWRFFMHEVKPITGSLYLTGEEETSERITGGYLFDYVKRVIDQIHWCPERLWSLDICESEGELKVLEIGSFSCAGEYDCNLSLYVQAGAAGAMEDWHEAYEE